MITKKSLASFLLLSIISSSSSYAVPLFSKTQSEDIEMSERRVAPTSLVNVDRGKNKTSLKKKAVLGSVVVLGALAATAGIAYTVTPQAYSLAPGNFSEFLGNSSNYFDEKCIFKEAFGYDFTPDFQATNATHPSYLRKESRKDFLNFIFSGKYHSPQEPSFDFLAALNRSSAKAPREHINGLKDFLYVLLISPSNMTYQGKADKTPGYYGGPLGLYWGWFLSRKEQCEYIKKIKNMGGFTEEEKRIYDAAFQEFLKEKESFFGCFNFFYSVPEKQRERFLRNHAYSKNTGPIIEYIEFKAKEKNLTTEQVAFDELTTQDLSNSTYADYSDDTDDDDEDASGYSGDTGNYSGDTKPSATTYENMFNSKGVMIEEFRSNFLDYFFSTNYTPNTSQCSGFHPSEYLNEVISNINRSSLYVYLQVPSGNTCSVKTEAMIKRPSSSVTEEVWSWFGVALVRCKNILEGKVIASEGQMKFQEAVYKMNTSTCEELEELKSDPDKIKFLTNYAFSKEASPILEYISYLQSRQKRSADGEVQGQIFFDEMREPAYAGKSNLKKREADSKGALSPKDAITVSQIFEYFPKRYLSSVHPTTSNPSPIIGSSTFSAKRIPAIVISQEIFAPSKQEQIKENKSNPHRKLPKYHKNAMGKR